MNIVKMPSYYYAMVYIALESPKGLHSTFFPTADYHSFLTQLEKKCSDSDTEVLEQGEQTVTEIQRSRANHFSRIAEDGRTIHEVCNQIRDQLELDVPPTINFARYNRAVYTKILVLKQIFHIDGREHVQKYG